jgi:hypothetical protein
VNALEPVTTRQLKERKNSCTSSIRTSVQNAASALRPAFITRS